MNRFYPVFGIGNTHMVQNMKDTKVCGWKVRFTLFPGSQFAPTMKVWVPLSPNPLQYNRLSTLIFANFVCTKWSAGILFLLL